MSYDYKIPTVEVKQKEWTPAEAPQRTYGRLEVREECDQNGPRWDLVRVDGGTIARDLDEDTARRLAGCWNRSDGFSTGLMASPDAPRFIDQLMGEGAARVRTMHAWKEAKDDAEVLRLSLNLMTAKLNELVGACTGPEGGSIAPPMKVLQRVRGFLPDQYSNSYAAKKGQP